ncbi:GDP-fucose transporter 1-like isoform X2 [Corticium candelabrum]|uniref:GDP-fucose transporter 1-like isoform X2 n=1 Tax=Corticium candelabrum TaxID=121492 RepID=UPI002E252D92|nr:GDP-fucose transporter 1-like isoform X2 [Corticium candelabrum]
MAFLATRLTNKCLVGRNNLFFPFLTLSLKMSNTIFYIMPLSIVFVGMISFNNLSLKYLGVAFYTVGRSLTTVFNVVLTYFVLNTTTSMQTLLCCAVIITGFLLGVNQEGSTGHLSYGGVICGVMASLFVALNAVYSKRALPLVNNNPWKLNYYNCLNGMFLFIPFMVLFGEVDVVASYPRLTSSDFWFVMTFTGIVGSLLGFVAGLQIKVTSALTHNISGTAKACLQTVMVVVINKEVKSFLWWLSNAMVLVGSAVYVMVRRVEMKMEMGVENKEKESDTEEDAVRIETSDDVKSNL